MYSGLSTLDLLREGLGLGLESGLALGLGLGQVQLLHQLLPTIKTCQI